MPKSDHRRQRISEEIRKLSEAASVLAGRIKWACRDVLDRRAKEIDGPAECLANDLFALAQDVASGRVELDGPDSPRPLFDRPRPGDPAVRLEASEPLSGPGNAPFAFELVAEDGTPHPVPVVIHAASTIEAATRAAEQYPGWFVRIAGRDGGESFAMPPKKPRKRKESVDARP